MKDLIGKIAEAMVDHPEEVAVSELGSDQTIVLELQVAKQDLGKIIGKKGKNVQAIRTILSAAAGKTGKKYILELVE